jgi:hypothetical protein
VTFHALKQAISLSIIISIFSNTALATGYANRTIASESRNAEDINSLFDEYHYAMDDWDGKSLPYKQDAEVRLADGLLKSRLKWKTEFSIQ